MLQIRNFFEKAHLGKLQRGRWGYNSHEVRDGYRNIINGWDLVKYPLSWEIGRG